MSIATSIEKLSETLTNCKTNLKEKGVEADNIKISDVDEKIMEIQAGGGNDFLHNEYMSIDKNDTVLIPYDLFEGIPKPCSFTLTIDKEKLSNDGFDELNLYLSSSIEITECSNDNLKNDHIENLYSLNSNKINFTVQGTGNQKPFMAFVSSKSISDFYDQGKCTILLVRFGR